MVTHKNRKRNTELEWDGKTLKSIAVSLAKWPLLVCSVCGYAIGHKYWKRDNSKRNGSHEICQKEGVHFRFLTLRLMIKFSFDGCCFFVLFRWMFYVRTQISLAEIKSSYKQQFRFLIVLCEITCEIMLLTAWKSTSHPSQWSLALYSSFTHE